MSVEFTGKKACIAPEGVFIIGTYDENGVPNAMNAAWGAQSDYDEITLFLAKHKTTESSRLYLSYPKYNTQPESGRTTHAATFWYVGST